MRCRTCDYPLWNLKTRHCPECGGAFLPSQFEFVINSVQFCCPHCNQSYYGTGEKGHLVPFEFNCVTCGRRIDMDQTCLRPTHGVTEEQTNRERMPWLEKERRGFFKAWLATIAGALFAPGRLMRATPPESPTGAMVTFVLITSIACALISGVPRLVFFLMMFSTMTARPGTMLSALLPFVGTSVLLGALMPFVLVFVMTPLVHGALRLFGKTEFGMRRTCLALGYSSGANVGAAVPCVGQYFSWIWWTISAIVAVSEAQSVGKGRATLAVLAAAALGFMAWLGAFFALMAIGTGMTTPMGARAAFPNPTLETSVIVQNLNSYASSHGQWPWHGVQLMNIGLAANDFVSALGSTDPASIPIGDTTLDQLDLLPPGRRSAATQAAASALPNDVIAHRCGDFVFTYHRIDLNAEEPGLWLVIFSPDSSSGPTMSLRVVGLADGTTRQFVGDVSTALAAQNELRAKHNLPPLPDPATVTHRKPAAGKLVTSE